MEIPGESFDVATNGLSARLSLDDLPMPDTFFFSNNVSISSEIDVNVVWRATGPPVPRGEGLASPAPFFTKHLGEFAEAQSRGRASGRQTGFNFATGRLTADGFYATLGPQRNGVYL